jgi:putative salt-induced outer membrane protein YdiY
MTILQRRTQLAVALLLTTAGVASADDQAAAPAPATPAKPAAPATPPAEKKPQWESSIAAGLTMTRGNSDNFLVDLTAKTDKKWDKNELGFGAEYAYGTTKTGGVNTRNTDSMRGFAQYNRLFTERLYGYLHAEGLHDEISAVKYRVSTSPGAGYYFIKDKATQLSAEAGPGYVVENLGGERQSYATLRVGEKFKHELSDRSRLWQSAEWLPQVDDFKNYIINAEVGIEGDLNQTKTLSLRAVLQDTYNNVPAAGRQKNDAKLIAAVAYKF